MSARTVLAITEEAWGAHGRVVRALDDAEPGDAWGVAIETNVLADDGWTPSADDTPPGGRAIVWSGSLEEDLFERSARNWLSEGMARFNAWLDGVLPALEASGTTLLVRPHARHTLCDAYRTGHFLGAREGQPVGLALAPTDILEADMLGVWQDHVARALETLGGRASCVILSGVRPGADDDAPLERVAPGGGVLDDGALAAMVAEATAPGTPLLVDGAGSSALEAATRFARLA